MEFWVEMVELYEYKVADVVAGRDPRGGRRSLVALRDALLYGSLDSALQRRFRHADRLWRDYTVVAPPDAALLPGASPGTLEDWNMTPGNPPDVEGEQLERLAQGLWRLRLDDHLTRLTAHWRRENGLVTLRSLYALSLNLEAGQLRHNVPEENDPLVSLGNPQIALGVLGALIDLLLEYRSDTLTPVAWARSVMLELANNPFPKPKAGHDAFTPPARRPAERAQIREALGRGFETLSGLLPSSLGGSGDHPPVLQHLLFAHNPARRQSEPDATTTLALRLAGSGEIRWHSQVISWQKIAQGWQLQVGGAVYPLRREEHGVGLTRIPLEGAELRALLRGEYLVLDLRQVHGASLTALVAVGHAVAALLEDSDQYLHLRLARGVAQWLRDGHLDAGALGPQSAAKYAGATHESLLAFARKGVENLLARLAKRGEAEATRAFREVARLLGCPEDRAIRLLDRLREARERPQLSEASEVRREGEVVLLAYQGTPLTVSVMGRMLTLRADYQGEVTAVLPGSPALPVQELQVFVSPQGGVIVARQGMRLAVTYQRALAPA
ncbi:hypothetical protein [Deinococcus peraridilitoris]|uniref:hypothetical protein n=1 Tax=Deinococcus peraridilitoris TaxID=432329 RepID=UPI0012FB72CB|nr:hypothetical protein [Deinococcus peraridilitoris]